MLSMLAAAVLISTAAGLPVAEWVERPMSAADLDCANRSAREWAVRLDPDGVVRAFPEEDRQLFEQRVEGGFFVGVNRGEWGGGAWWLGDDGRSTHLTTANVRSIVVDGEDVWLLSDRFGRAPAGVHRVRRGTWGWGLEHVRDLATRGQRAMADGAGGLLVVASDGLHRVTRSGEASRLTDSSFGVLSPSSMVRDARGHVFVGMRHVVVELVPEQPLWRVRWLVPQDCARFTVRDEYRCECQGSASP